MSCNSLRPALLMFDVGALSPEEHESVDVHLRTCSACVAAYLDHKKLVTPADERPSAALRARLRSAVAVELGLVAPPRPWWHRAVVVGLAAAAVLVAMVSVNAVATGDVSPPVGLQREAAAPPR